MGYGYDTKSWRNSTENRQLKQERAEFTAKFQTGELQLANTDLRLFIVCTCLSFRYPHTLDAHQKLRSEYDWRTFQQREREDAGWQRFREPIK